MATAQAIPLQVFKAKTIYVINQTGKPGVENGADSAISKWGRFTMADDADSADIRLVIAKAGTTSTESETPKQTGVGTDKNYSTSFTFGYTAWAYVKGQKLYFWSGGSSSSGTSGGKGVVEDFRKLFPKD